MLGLSIPTLAARTRLGPVPPLPQPAPLTNIVIEGDSLTNQVPGDSGASAQRWPWLYQAVKPAGTTAPVRAQGSRYIGDPSMLDDDSNTLFGNVTEDATTHGGQLIWAAPFLTNDFGTPFHGAAGATRAATIKARLAAYWHQVRAKGCKLAFGYAPPLRSDAGNPDWNATCAAFVPNFRDPAVWGQYCDYYVPVGEQPDFNAADNSALIDAGDKVHPTVAGQLKLLEANRSALDALFDAARVGSTTMYPAAWPTGSTGLAPSTQVTRRFVVSGVAHKGLALTGATALSATNGAEVRVNGGAWATTASGWLYNGDTIDLRITSSAAADTVVQSDLTVGTETRTLSFRTASAASAPVAYAHGDVEGNAPQDAVHAYPARPFAAPGVAVIGLAARTGATGVTVGGTAAVRRATQVGMYGEMTLELWTAPVATAGPKDLVVTFASSQHKSAVSWGTVTGAGAQVQVSVNAVDGADPHGTGVLDVPANGLALGAFGEYGGATITPAVVASGTAIDEGAIGFQGETFGLSLAQRTTPGALGWTFGYGPYPVAALIFTPA